MLDLILDLNQGFFCYTLTMNNQKGFGLIGLLITLAIIVGMAFGGIYALNNLGTIDLPEYEDSAQTVDLKENQNSTQTVGLPQVETTKVDVSSVIKRAEDLKQKLEEANSSNNIQ